MRKERLELSRVAPLAPKASASTNSATFACQPVIISNLAGCDHAGGKYLFARSGRLPSIGRDMSLFDLAFPASMAAHRQAAAGLKDGSEPAVEYAFSFPVARWLARRCPGQLSIDWDAFDDTTRLDELLRLLLSPAEDDYFDSGWVSTREWIDIARAGHDGTDFDWLLAQLTDKGMQRVWAQLYDAAEIPLVWDVTDSRYAKSKNFVRVPEIELRDSSMRKRRNW